MSRVCNNDWTGNNIKREINTKYSFNVESFNSTLNFQHTNSNLLKFTFVTLTRYILHVPLELYNFKYHSYRIFVLSFFLPNLTKPNQTTWHGIFTLLQMKFSFVNFNTFLLNYTISSNILTKFSYFFFLQTLPNQVKQFGTVFSPFHRWNSPLWTLTRSFYIIYIISTIILIKF